MGLDGHMCLFFLAIGCRFARVCRSIGSRCCVPTCCPVLPRQSAVSFPVRFVFFYSSMRPLRFLLLVRVTALILSLFLSSICRLSLHRYRRLLASSLPAAFSLAVRLFLGMVTDWSVFLRSLSLYLWGRPGRFPWIYTDFLFLGSSSPHFTGSLAL